MSIFVPISTRYLMLFDFNSGKEMMLQGFTAPINDVMQQNRKSIGSSTDSLIYPGHGFQFLPLLLVLILERSRSRMGGTWEGQLQ